MATRWAVASGNKSNAAIWNGGTKPGAGDDVYADGYTVTIDEDMTVNSIRTTQRSGGTAGGGFTLNAGVTVTATQSYANGGGFIIGTTVLFSYSANSGIATLVGDFYMTPSYINGINVTGLGTLNCIGYFKINAAYATMINVANQATVNVTGDCYGYINNDQNYTSYIILCGVANATINVIGSVWGGTNAIPFIGGTISLTSSSILDIIGDLTAGNSPAVLLSGGATLLQSGTITSGLTCSAVYSQNASVTVVCTGPFINNNSIMAVLSPKLSLKNETLTTRWELTAQDTTSRNLYSADTIGGNPAIADVRAGTTYGPVSELTGTCAVPAAASVLVGVPVDATVGTAAISAASIQAALGMSSANLDTQLSALNALLTSTGVKVASIVNGAIAATTFAAGALDAVWSTASRTLSSAGVQAIWDALTSALTTAGSIGKRIADYLDAAVSSRSTYAGADTAGTGTLLSRIVGTLSAGTHNPQSGDAYARLGAPNGASIAADVTEARAAVAALHDFDPTTDTVARVTLVDTVTDLTNSPDVPTEAEIAAQVRVELAAELASVAAMEARLEEQVPTGPVVVTPAPGVGQTTAWTQCYDEAGLPEEGVTITITCTKSTDGGAFDATPVTLTSDGDGLAAGPIPRGAGLTFTARRGSGRPVRFTGVDAETLELPPLVGAP